MLPNLPDSFELGNRTITSERLLVYAAVIVGGLLVLLLVQMYWTSRLKNWAESQGMQLIRFRSAWFFQGPSAWRRSRNQHVFRVTVRDQYAMERNCWIVFGTFWGFTWGEPITKVEWIDDL
jgi:hypothetical protein